MAVNHCWLPGGVHRRPQRVTSADKLQPSPLLLRPLARQCSLLLPPAAAQLDPACPFNDAADK